MSEPYRGSLDPFQDIAEQLKAMDVAYCLVIGMSGDPVTNVWSNASDWGPEGISNISHAVDVEMKKQQKNLEE